MQLMEHEFALFVVILGHGAMSLCKQKGDVHGKRRCAALFLASFLLQTHYKYHTHVVVQTLGCDPRICMVGPDARLYCHAIMCSNRFGMARQLLYFSSGHGQLRGSPYAARHTCRVWPCQGRLWSQGNQIGREYVYSPFGAVYTASRFAVRQIQQVHRFLELLLELTEVPVGRGMVRQVCAGVRLD